MISSATKISIAKRTISPRALSKLLMTLFSVDNRWLILIRNFIIGFLVGQNEALKVTVIKIILEIVFIRMSWRL